MILEETSRAALLFFIIATMVNYVCYKIGFYKIRTLTTPTIQFKKIVVILMAFSAHLWTTPFFTLFLNKSFFITTNTVFLVTFCIPLSFTVFLICYSIFQKNPNFKKIWKNKSPTSPSILYDIYIGIFSWILAFPTITFISYICTLILMVTNFYDPSYEQNAVLYLKKAFLSPINMFFALGNIILISPIIEEFVFRGSLQTYFKQHFNKKTAIALAAACFAFYHFSSYQKTENFPIISSLFIFGCFLGFIYERQGSLYASITLHMIFNIVNSARIALI
jgi:membrane protease YdiL (CAAX protease family)